MTRIATKNIIYCIGDSHADFFSGFDAIGPEYPNHKIGSLPFFQSFRLGAPLAYNLCEFGTASRGREKLFEILKNTNQKNVKILLCFGEIDCRAHLLKQSRIKNLPITTVVNDCVDRYFRVVKEVQSMGFEVMVWNAIPSTLFENTKYEFPTFGNCRERNQATRLFNDHLKNLCDANQIKLISIFDSLVDKDNITKMEFYMDAIHLSQKAMPIALKEFKKQIPDMDFAITVNQKLSFLISKINKHNLKLFLYNIDKKTYKLLAGKTSTQLPYNLKRKIIQDYAEKFSADILIETGTYLGDTIESLKDQFKKIFSIELDFVLYEKAVKRFENNPKISILYGDSSKILPSIVTNNIESTLFWLDGHYSGTGTARGESNTPILKELEIILNNHPEKHIILIDDARLFIGEEGYPTIKDLCAFIYKTNNRLNFDVKDDIIRITPSSSNKQTKLHHYRESPRQIIAKYYLHLGKSIKKTIHGKN